jgi:hypothetical protein
MSYSRPPKNKGGSARRGLPSSGRLFGVNNVGVSAHLMSIRVHRIFGCFANSSERDRLNVSPPLLYYFPANIAGDT